VLKKPQALRVRIMHGVEIGANSCVDRGSWRDTYIGEHTKLDNMVQIGHNAVIGRGCLLCAHCAIGGSAELGDWVVMGGKAAVKDHVSVVSKVRIAAKAGVTHSLTVPGDYAGFPALSLSSSYHPTAAARHPGRPKERTAQPKGGTYRPMPSVRFQGKRTHAHGWVRCRRTFGGGAWQHSAAGEGARRPDETCSPIDEAVADRAAANADGARGSYYAPCGFEQAKSAWTRSVAALRCGAWHRPVALCARSFDAVLHGLPKAVVAAESNKQPFMAWTERCPSLCVARYVDTTGH